MRVLDARSVGKLTGVNPDLVKVVQEAFNLSPVPFIITDGLRTADRQSYLFASGKSRTLLSKHIEGKAVDVAAVVDGRINWSYNYYEEIAKYFFIAADRLRIPIVWGGSWPKFRDGCHFRT